MENNYVSYTFPAWGTIIYVSHQAIEPKVMEAAKSALINYFAEIDLVFSTYREDSEVSGIRSSKIQEFEYSDLMREVLKKCEMGRELTEGYFDPWSIPTGLDTSGFVKGWATQKGVELLNSFGIKSAQINSAGDIYLSGGFNGAPWSIGIRHPDDAQTIVKVFNVWEGAVVTSGTYERGSHIFDPFTKTIAIGARSATVLGPDGGVAEALATALIVAGRDGARWFSKPALSEYSAWVIERHSDQAWGINLK